MVDLEQYIIERFNLDSKDPDDHYVFDRQRLKYLHTDGTWNVCAGNSGTFVDYQHALDVLTETVDPIPRMPNGRPDLGFPWDGDAIIVSYGSRIISVDFESRKYKLPADRDVVQHWRMICLAISEQSFQSGWEARGKSVRSALGITES